MTLIYELKIIIIKINFSYKRGITIDSSRNTYPPSKPTIGHQYSRKPSDNHQQLVREPPHPFCSSRVLSNSVHALKRVTDFSSCHLSLLTSASWSMLLLQLVTNVAGTRSALHKHNATSEPVTDSGSSLEEPRYNEGQNQARPAAFKTLSIPSSLSQATCITHKRLELLLVHL